MTRNLENKIIIITGAARGIGAACAKYYVEQGATVVCNDVDADALAETVRAIGDGAEAHVGSVSDPDYAQDLVQSTVARHGRLDGLHNNAGLFHVALATEEDPQQMRRLIEVNVLGTMYCGTAALSVFTDQGSGSLVNVTSGTQTGAATLSTYGASKGAIASLTYAWALEVAGTGVRVNALSPNAETRMADSMNEWLTAHQVEVNVGDNEGKQPVTNAPAATFLLSDLSQGVNGQVLRVDGPHLSLMTHPRFLLPAATSDHWTPESVAAALAEGGALAGYQQPVGTMALEAGTTN